jgi:hypothetical protein
VFGFCLSCVWLVPLALFISLSIGGNSLPTIDDSAKSGASKPGSASASAGAASAGGTGGVSLKRLFQFFSLKQRNSLLPTKATAAAAAAGEEMQHLMGNHSHSGAASSGGGSEAAAHKDY